VVFQGLHTKWFQSKYEYLVREEVREVRSSADPLLLQPTVYLMDSQDGQHEYPVREEVRELTVLQLIHCSSSQLFT
jgi:hypothetical protein